MTTQNAIKKLEKNGFKVVQHQNIKSRYIATLEGNRHFIELCTQNDEVIIVDLRTHGEEDDAQSDYHAGTFCDNISQAIRILKSL